MESEINVIQVGLGPMGQLITNLLLKRKNINLIGAVDINPELVGKTIKEIFNIPYKSEIVIHSNLEDVNSEEKIDVTIIATSSSLISTPWFAASKTPLP